MRLWLSKLLQAGRQRIAEESRSFEKYMHPQLSERHSRGGHPSLNLAGLRAEARLGRLDLAHGPLIEGFSWDAELMELVQVHHPELLPDSYPITAYDMLVRATPRSMQEWSHDTLERYCRMGYAKYITPILARQAFDIRYTTEYVMDMFRRCLPHLPEGTANEVRRLDCKT